LREPNGKCRLTGICALGGSTSRSDGDEPPTAQPSGWPPPAPSEAPVVAGQVTSAFADRLDRTTRETRKASRRSWLALGILATVGVGAVAAGVVAENEKFWTYPGIAFSMAMAGVVAYAANRLAIDSHRGPCRPRGIVPTRT
jgi:hypothetical protein